ncbi:MAG: helix-turn-helix domain-containing protein [Bacteroidales bacterium]|nr:helix-turn-helix domain-containing protein [Bacteroidales bacterium]
MSYFGKNIRKIRVAKKMTQTEFAELFDLKRTALGSYEEGRAEAKIDTIIKIADYFKLTLDQLLRKELTINEIFHFKNDFFYD